MLTNLRCMKSLNKLFLQKQNSTLTFGLYWNAKAYLSIHLGGLENCKITNDEDCKFILIEHADLAQKEFLVRGNKSHAYHKNIWQEFCDHEISPVDKYKYKIRGGGIIMHNSDTIHIGGKSNAFGASDHKIVQNIIKNKFPTKKIVIEKEDWTGFGDKYKY